MKIIDQDSSDFIRSLGIDLLLSSNLLEETIEICTNERFKNNNIVQDL